MCVVMVHFANPFKYNHLMPQSGPVNPHPALDRLTSVILLSPALVSCKMTTILATARPFTTMLLHVTAE